MSDDDAREWGLLLLMVVLPVVVAEVGAGVREHMAARREGHCPHGRPGGRLCPYCAAEGRHHLAAAGAVEEEESADDDPD